MNMEKTKKRGCNYTAAEKDFLLELVNKYIYVIESKEVNSQMIMKKREAWDSVCQQYNNVAVSGQRTWQQLRHLFENLKQRSKRNSAKTSQLHIYEKIKEFQKTASLDKMEINHPITTTGGKTNHTEQDAQIRKVVTSHVQPLSNPYDDAAGYFGDAGGAINQTGEKASSNFVLLNTSYGTENQHTTMVNDTTMAQDSKPCTFTSNIADNQEATIDTVNQKRKKPQTLVTSSHLTGQVKPTQKESSIKQQYLMTKLRNAKLEQEHLINKKKMEINKYRMEMQILKLRLKRLQSPRHH